MQRSKSLPLTLAFALSTGLLANQLTGCGPGSDVGSGGTGGKGTTGAGGGSGPGTGGRPATGAGGGSNPGAGGGANPGAGGSGNPGAGGSGNPGTGGRGGTTGAGGNGNPGAGGSGNPGTGGRGGSTGAGGGGTGTGGGTAGAGAARACAPASGDVISDFEEGFGQMVKQGGRTGFWYTYSDGTDGQNQTPAKPAALMADQIAVEASGDTAMCNKYAFHSTATGHPMYVGFGASFLPAPLANPPSQMKSPYDVSMYDGITFKAKTGGGATSQPLYFEVLTRDNQPVMTDSGQPVGGLATVKTIDVYNTRGQIVTVSSTSYTQFYVPFGTLIPRWMPAVGSGMVCPPSGAGVPKCQAPKFNPMNAMGIQLSFYNDPGFPKPNPAGAYNIWVDDVAFYKRSASTPDLPAAPTSAGAAHPFPNNTSVNARCGKPTQADGQYLTLAYKNWKDNFTRAEGGGIRVVRPAVETGSGEDTVSEGIAYGMLISVYMNDKALFDGLWTYWKAHCAVGSGNTCLMTWRIGGAGGQGSAIDADEDAAFALLMASKQWGSSYATPATDMMGAILSAETGTSAPFVYGGNNYKTNGTNVTNPSYFAPAWYRAFAAASGNAAWTTLANNAYTQLNAISSSSGVMNGLVPAWCSQNCSAAATNTDGANDILYQYDSHRVPWRIGMDYCWNGTAAAQTYLNKIIPFFAGKDGVGRIFDIYTPSSGREGSAAAVNSASLIGMAGSGAMFNASMYRGFLDDSYQLVLDLLNRAKLAELGDGTKSAYSYFNATVGMLALLTMSGNFTLFQ